MNIQTFSILMIISLIIFGFYGALICRVRFLTEKPIPIRKDIVLSAENPFSTILMEDLAKHHLEREIYECHYLALRKVNYYFVYFTLLLLLLFVISVINFQFMAF